MIRNIFLTVIESCHPYHKLVGVIDARESIENGRKNFSGNSFTIGNLSDREESVLALQSSL